MIKKYSAFLVAILLVIADARAASKLQAAAFPKTFSDLSFSEKLDVKTKGYEPYDGLKPYQIIDFIEMEDEAHDAIEKELKAQGINQCENCDENGNAPAQDGTTYVVVTPPAKPSTPVQPVPSHPDTVRPNANEYCALRHPKIPQSQQVPLGQPVNMQDMPDPSTFTNPKTQNIIQNTLKGLMCSPYGCREKPGKENTTRPHTGVDIGCTADFYRMPIYSPADGVVSILKAAKKGESAGNYIAINHGSEWTTQYMHLDEILVSKGQHVSAGCLIGYMGYTGGNADQKNPSMGKDLTHLHYEILYSGRASSITTPKGTTIPIIREKSCSNSKGFKTKIKPNDLMTYYDE